MLNGVCLGKPPDVRKIKRRKSLLEHDLGDDACNKIEMIKREA